MHVLHRLLLAASSRFFYFHFFSDWARHSRLYTMSSKNCDVCTLLMRARGLEEVEGYRDDDMMLMMNKNEANERTSEWSWDEIIVLIWKTALHSTFLCSLFSTFLFTTRTRHMAPSRPQTHTRLSRNGVKISSICLRTNKPRVCWLLLP